MQVLNLKQGSADWLAHRAKHFNASDAPAMMACSPYKTRTQLMHELHTGLTPEVNEHQQRRFDEGHEFERLALPLAEEIIGEDLSPLVGTDGRLSASFDGITMEWDTCFEHKSLNDQLRAALFSDEGADALPLHYRVQMEQQLLVSGAARVLFMASKWNGEDLVEEMHCWYESDDALRAQIVSGWEQFAADLAAYVPTPVTPPVTAAAMESLPAVSVRLAGELQVVSNLPEFGTALRAFIGRMVPKPSTDQEFANAEAECKALKKAEEAIDAADEYSLASLTDVAAARTMMADLRSLARTTRLAREKLVTAEKENRRTAIVTTAAKAFRDYLIGLNERLGGQFMPQTAPDFAGVIKGKKNLDSMQDAVDGLLAQSKVTASGTADLVQANLKHLGSAAADYRALFPDLAALVLKPADDFEAVVQFRVADQVAKEKRRTDALLEQQREQIRREEAARLENEQRAARAAEDELVASIERQATRIEGETVAYIKKAITAFETAAMAYAEDKRERVTAAIATARTQMQAKLEAAEQRDRAAAEAPAVAPAAAPSPAPAPAAVTPLRSPAPVAATPAPGAVPTLSIGQIGTRLGFTLPATFLQQLGFEPTRQRGAVLFHESEWPLIKRALVKHVQELDLEAQAA